MKGVRETPSKALVGELAQRSGDSAAAAFSVRQVGGQRVGGERWRPEAGGAVGKLISRRRDLAGLHASQPAHPPTPQALSTLGMLLGSAAAALAFRLSGHSYEVCRSRGGLS